MESRIETRFTRNQTPSSTLDSRKITDAKPCQLFTLDSTFFVSQKGTLPSGGTCRFRLVRVYVYLHSVVKRNE